MPTTTNTTQFSIVSRTDTDTMTIITARQLPQGQAVKVWTLVTLADGTDYVITPEGEHIDSFEAPVRVQPFTTWLSENV